MIASLTERWIDALPMVVTYQHDVVGAGRKLVFVHPACVRFLDAVEHDSVLRPEGAVARLVGRGGDLDVRRLDVLRQRPRGYRVATALRAERQAPCAGRRAVPDGMPGASRSRVCGKTELERSLIT